MSATATCHCGACTIVVAAAPVEVTDCNCSICRRYGVLWAYYVPGDVDVSGSTETYVWGNRTVVFHRCTMCGCVTHWASPDPARQRMGVNARLLPPEVLAAARVRHLDGAGTEEYVD
ncbi:GFA family protein [Glacieibacterium frigidum]|uniref:GFA family protein n=1 Tax=Glacieibacterium frigidum TaxID=2593303 RepID=A0A552U716_9SPHN|nr:GFA family protein [Glacieibacterium frigidum]TRW14013.1 GFA family protein [Glacieibacterium frigidum]